jgi:Family of unknown function (DUF5670)
LFTFSDGEPWRAQGETRQSKLLLDRITTLWRNKANLIERNTMLWTIVVILVVLWLLGFISHVGGGLIHLLIVIAVIIVIINLIQGRRGL